MKLQIRRRPRLATGAHSTDIVFTFAVGAVSLLPRLFVALAWSREPVWDGHYYHFGALRIAQGLGYSEDVVVNGVHLWRPWCHYPIGYSALLAAFYRLFGGGLLVAPVVNAVVGALVVMIVHRLALRAATVNRARFAASITALHPGLIVYSALLMNEALCGFLILGAAWAAVRRLSWWSTALSGVLFGLATLVRPSSILVAPLVVFLLPLPRMAALGRAVTVSAIAIATVLPWTFRNCRVMDGCAFVSTNGGWNLAIGALTSTGRFHALHASDGCPVVTGQVQQDRCWAEVGRQAILSDPVSWLKLAPKKLAQTYDHESFAIEYLREADPGGWPESRRVAGRALLTVFHQILLAAAALGLIALPSPRRLRAFGAVTQGLLLVGVLGFTAYSAASYEHPFWVLAVLLPVLGFIPLAGSPPIGGVDRFLLVWIFVTSLTHAVFFGDDRYHLVITPALCILASSGLRRLAARTPATTPVTTAVA